MTSVSVNKADHNSQRHRMVVPEDLQQGLPEPQALQEQQPLKALRDIGDRGGTVVSASLRFSAGGNSNV